MRYLICLICSTCFAQFDFNQPIKFLALGDSYTVGASVAYQERWPSQLYDSLAKLDLEIDTLHYIATSGWTTTDLQRAIRSTSYKNDYNLVSLLIGVNNEYQNKSFSLYQKEFPQLLSRAIEFANNDSSQVFVVSIPDYAYTPFGGNNESISERLDQYNQFAESYCNSLGIKFFYITDISRKGLDAPELVANDDLHPSGKQYAKWVDLILLEYETDQIKATEGGINSFFEIYPNPTSGKIWVTTQSRESVVVYNCAGELVYKTNEQLINLTSYPKGIYFLKQGDHYEKIMVK